MPKCKNCNAEISRLDKDICPFCGQRKPLEGQEAYTQDFTKAFDPIKSELENVKMKSRVTAGVLAILLGVFGAHMFYLGRKKYGFILCGITALFIASLGCVLYFTHVVPVVLAFLIPYFVLEVVMIISGILILTRHDFTDANGEFLK